MMSAATATLRSRVAMPGRHRLQARGDASQRTPVTRSELAQQGGNVTLYRPDRDEEPGANLSIGQMLGDTLEHLGLPGRHTRRRPSLPHLLDSPRCHSRRQRELLAGGGPNPKNLRRDGHTQPAPSTFIESQPAHANERAAVKTSLPVPASVGHNYRPESADQYGAPESRIRSIA
jgi:hypothetical protein